MLIGPGIGSGVWSLRIENHKYSHESRNHWSQWRKTHVEKGASYFTESSSPSEGNAEAQEKRQPWRSGIEVSRAWNALDIFLDWWETDKHRIERTHIKPILNSIKHAEYCNSGKGTIDMPLMPSCGEAARNPGTSILQPLLHARQSHEIEKRRWPHQRFFSQVESNWGIKVSFQTRTHSSFPDFFYLINK